MRILDPHCYSHGKARVPIDITVFAVDYAADKVDGRVAAPEFALSSPPAGSVVHSVSLVFGERPAPTPTITTAIIIRRMVHCRRGRRIASYSRRKSGKADFRFTHSCATGYVFHFPTVGTFGPNLAGWSARIR